MEFLDERLRTPADNILQENLFIILSSMEMIALTRVCAIIHLAICMPLRWLAGNSHTFGEHCWSVTSMGKAIDTLESNLMMITQDNNKILNEQFMMDIFKDLKTDFPPLADCCKHMFEVKKIQWWRKKTTRWCHWICSENDCLTKTWMTTGQQRT